MTHSEGFRIVHAITGNDTMRIEQCLVAAVLLESNDNNKSANSHNYAKALQWLHPSNA